MGPTWTQCQGGWMDKLRRKNVQISAKKFCRLLFCKPAYDPLKCCVNIISLIIPISYNKSINLKLTKYVNTQYVNVLKQKFIKLFKQIFETFLQFRFYIFSLSFPMQLSSKKHIETYKPIDKASR